DEDDNDTAEAEAAVDGEAEDAAEASDTESDAAIEIVEGGTSTRRRRRRRRRGEDTTGSDDDPTDVVVRVRQPRRSKGNDEVTGIDGSTRMEAKRQRRREGRAAGRRRAPILSEAEFLARREAVDRTMLVRQADDYAQIAVLEDGVLVEHYVDRASATSMIGNVYLGKVQNVLPSMEAAFIDIGRGRNAVLYAGEVDWDAFGVTGGDRKMEKVFKSGQSVLVQVSKDPVGAKGARLTAHVSIPGRYVVYSPSGQLSGISRKLPEGERARLKGILDELVGDRASVIVRTAAEGASEDELVRDVNRLKAQWEVIEKKVKAGKSPTQLYAEPDLTVRIVRDLFTEDFGQLIVDGNGKGEDAWDTVDAYVSHVAPHLKERLVHWDRSESGDLFAAHRLDEQIAKALERKVFLPSGGSLIIDRTEAMTVIDVNTGKFTGSGGNLEETVTRNNLEAAEEVVRQLRLRDLGGIIVVDFIDMVLPSNRELLLRRLVECLGRDRTRHQVSEVTSLGLVQMTRKRIGTGLAEAFTDECDQCGGRGYIRHEEPVDSQAPADGGERHGGKSSSNTGGRNNRRSKAKPKVEEAPAAAKANQVQPSEEAKQAASRLAAAASRHHTDQPAGSEPGAARQAELLPGDKPAGELLAAAQAYDSDDVNQNQTV
ncbi:Rne/Rng family ribonuclease, partial [Brooklawnia sp.]|uniref:Rne/Rng family ribonuclease n=1 Tax=Brooklawnia sp. TaxID=2699740 RepID=UPI00311EA337